MPVIVSKSMKKKISTIFEHPDDLYSIYLKDENADVIWAKGKSELYHYLHSLTDGKK